MTVITSGKLMRKAREGMYTVNIVKHNGKPICNILDKNGYYVGSCIVGYVEQLLETSGIMDEIIKRYEKLLKGKRL